MIKVSKLRFSYTDKPFIEDMNFNALEGEIFGFLGPSGAGKSTLQKILTGILTSYSGSAQVNDIEVKNRNSSFYENIGVDFEFSSLYEKFTARENLRYFASLYKNKPLNIDKLLESVGLLNDGDKRVSEYSKGMKTRLNFIKAMIHQPKILFLDEPTSGLDPSNARNIKSIIKDLRKQGRTIILTTHNMGDAAELCDRVAFIVDGRIKALDTPENFMNSKPNSLIRYTYMYEGKIMTRETSIDKTGEDKTLSGLIESGGILSIKTLQPTLEDIFIEIAGRSLT